jgi:hypothetical protein
MQFHTQVCTARIAGDGKEGAGYSRIQPKLLPGQIEGDLGDWTVAV